MRSTRRIQSPKTKEELTKYKTLIPSSDSLLISGNQFQADAWTPSQYPIVENFNWGFYETFRDDVIPKMMRVSYKFRNVSSSFVLPKNSILEKLIFSEKVSFTVFVNYLEPTNYTAKTLNFGLTPGVALQFCDLIITEITKISDDGKPVNMEVICHTLLDDTLIGLMNDFYQNRIIRFGHQLLVCHNGTCSLLESHENPKSLLSLWEEGGKENSLA